MRFDLREIAWAAGLFDGEGTVSAKANGLRAGKDYRRLALKLGMTDKCVIERFAKVVGGSVYGPYKQNKYPNAKPVWDVHFQSFEAVQMIMCLLWNYLSEPKRNQFRTAHMRFLSQKRNLWLSRRIINLPKFT